MNLNRPNKLWVDEGRRLYNNRFQKGLDDNDTLMYSTHNEGKSVVPEKFIRTLKGKTNKRMTGGNSRSYLYSTIKLADDYNNSYDQSIGKNTVDADYSALTEEIETNAKAPKFKVGDRVSITKYQNIFNKVYTDNC